MKTRQLLLTSLLSSAAVLGAASVARADDPKFEYGKKEDVKAVEWKVSAQAGLILTTGNSRTTTTSGGLDMSRKEGSNKFQLSLGGAYAKSDIFIAQDTNMDGKIDFDTEVVRQTNTTTKAWNVKLRYDRFFTEHNSAFVTAHAEGDTPAGKDLLAGGQVGYSRQLFKDTVHEFVSEIGYDFSYQKYVANDTGTQIHSARLFVGYTGALSDTTALLGSGELMLNLNDEKVPDGVPPAAAFDDTRFTGKLGINTKLTKNVAFHFGFVAKYDSAPAPRPLFGGKPFAGTALPLVDKLDTTTEASLIISLI